MSFEDVFTKLKSNSAPRFEEAVRLLVKIADNIIENPNNLKVRYLQKGNSTVKNKILTVHGGPECLKLMGFRESDISFTFPSDVSVDKLKEVKAGLLSMKNSDASKGAIPKVKSEISTSNHHCHEENNDDLDNVKRFNLPPLKLKFSNPFLQRIETQFHHALAFGDKNCQERAKKLIPLFKLETNAQRNLRFLQIKIKNEKLIDPEFSIQDMLLLELLTWFKEDFFSWVDAPNCQRCGGHTAMSHMSTDPNDLLYTQRVEVYRCQTCPQLTKFPRYNDLNILLETRRGRCGEWAQVFTLMCRALGWDARYVIDELDHVWSEVYSVTQERWVHCDPCENACDTPLMYESGWNKKLTYIIAYSPEEVQDVTWRYSSCHKEVLARRKNTTEDELIHALVSLRNDRQKSFSEAKRNFLNKRLVSELVELLLERKPHENERNGRISGSKEWRLARGELNSENMYVWIIENKHIIDDKVTITYSAALDMYQFRKGDGSVVDVREWKYGVFEFAGIFRKVEQDWKVVYLARSEGTDEGRISWKFELEKGSHKVIDTLSLKFGHQTYEDGVADIKLISNETSLDFPKSDVSLETQNFSGARHFSIEARLSGGKGDVAWQHAQLFRQPVDCKEFPFVLSLTFKSTK